MRCAFTFALISVLLNLVSSASAVNLSFMPGDAFFSIRLTSELIDGLPSNGESLLFEYAYPKGSGDFCGYAGFPRIKIVGVTPEFVERIKSVYRDARRIVPQRIEVIVDDDGQREELELNGLQAFIYNLDVDWTKQRLGIKYNENWFDLPKEALAGTRGNSMIRRATACMSYVSFVSGARAVEHDWKCAARRAPLAAKIPEMDGWGIAGELIRDPVIVDSNDVQIVVLQNGSVKEAFEEEAGITFYAVTEEDVRYCCWDDDREEGVPRLYDATWAQGE